MKSQKLPQTDSIKELAEFWQTHDLTDFEDELEEVTEPVFERKTILQIELQPQDVEAVRETARQRGVSDTELIREWVLEKIRTALGKS
ncbi:hypothetical protein DSM106972_002990 [Dulcicalothrix desertica PCC 7102]|uniref:Uncharacterized protein n=1 Tax=Dulcicalothrix desertica PCC 7102 TaxID=232991 RepID=A0A433VUL6_9CYAN|nr:CopG family antitoxin [Dulcicalothrix desertica]RUT09804.1 hypothetical protein DSM106972_002990 [Dulcicalothrix desertica PCC 7102]TWH50994.1 CopG antitoxin of type II toxin-antitoxin system [Dulcicalothrix desertica PCC 7102]